MALVQSIPSPSRARDLGFGCPISGPGGRACTLPRGPEREPGIARVSLSCFRSAFLRRAGRHAAVARADPSSRVRHARPDLLILGGRVRCVDFRAARLCRRLYSWRPPEDHGQASHARMRFPSASGGVRPGSPAGRAAEVCILPRITRVAARSPQGVGGGSRPRPSRRPPRRPLPRWSMRLCRTRVPLS